VVPVELRCADGRRVTVQLAGLALADEAGRVCGLVRPQISQLTRFVVPASWGGRLVVIWALGAAAPNGSPLDLQVESAILPLGGKQVDCLSFRATGTPVS
jgi:hypothetical protein